MHRTDHTTFANGLVALALALATALALPALARAEMPAGYMPEVESELAILEQSRASEIPYLSHGVGVSENVGSQLESNQPGGVTPTNLARAYEQRFDGVAAPDGFQPQLRGGETLVIRDAPDGSQPQLRRSGEPGTVYATDAGRSIDRDDVALGFAAGLLVALMAAIAITFSSRNRVGVAHS